MRDGVSRRRRAAIQAPRGARPAPPSRSSYGLRARSCLRLGRVLVELPTARRASADAGAAIALDEALLRLVTPPVTPITLRLWESAPAVVVPRWRLRHATDHLLADGGYPRRASSFRSGILPLHVRCTGGTAVMIGPGTLNMSLVIPRSHPDVTHEEAYRLWLEILGRALKSTHGLDVSAATVPGAFCDGRFNAVCGGKKIAGTAQARTKNAILVHGTILIDVPISDYLTAVRFFDEILSRQAPVQLAESSADATVSTLNALVGGEVNRRKLASALVTAFQSIFSFGSVRIQSCYRPTPSERRRAAAIAHDDADLVSDITLGNSTAEASS
jgi:lipoate-protein ligase A